MKSLNRSRIIRLSPTWFLAHSKNYTNIDLRLDAIRGLWDEGPLKLYHHHGDSGIAYAYAVKRDECHKCLEHPDRDITGRAIWYAGVRGKYVLGFKGSRFHVEHVQA